jgi:RimJ/RimL family protein N-acetyltransferase
MNRCLLSARLLLRPFAPQDLDNVADLSGNAEKMKYIGPPLSRHQAKEALDWKIREWNRLGYGWFAVFEKQTRQFIGEVGIQAFEYDARARDVELAFIIKKQWQGRGYCTEAARAVLTFGFDRKQLDKIVSIATPDNLPSQKTLARLGFRFIDRRYAYGHPVLYYEITRQAFLAAG